MTIIVNNKVLFRGSYIKLTDGKFDESTSEILKNQQQKTVLTARVMQWKITDGQNQTKTAKHEAENMKLLE